MRVLLSIGCNRYANLPPLKSAVSDAENMFRSLTSSQLCNYSQDASLLIQDPSVQDLRNETRSLLSRVRRCDTFTVYFSGHAALRDECLYLCMIESEAEYLPSTSLGFPDLARIVATAEPDQVNFVIDACHSGGLGFDLNILLRRHLNHSSRTL
jgi:uncharacterized caspase-like protein